MHTRRETIAVAGLAVAGTAGCLAADDGSDAEERPADEGPADEGPADEEKSDPPTDEDPNEFDAVDPDSDAPLLTYDGGDEAEDRVLATYEDVAGVGAVDADPSNGHRLPLEFADGATESVVATLEELGALDESAEGGFELAVRVDGDRLDTYRLGPSLVAEMKDGRWDGAFVIGSADESKLETLRAELRSA